jgi:L-fuculose-phosphate aldolase
MASDESAALILAMCAVGRSAVSAGLVVASGGNLSARLPGAQTCWVTRTGTWLDRLVAADFVEVAIADGRVVRAGDAGTTAPSVEVKLHLATYRARPDVNAVVHLHPQTAILLDALGESVRLLTSDHAYYLRRVARVPFYPPGSNELASEAAAAVTDGTNCVILAHHGCSTLGADVPMAYRRASNLNEAAQLTYHALLLTGGLPGRPIPACPWEPPDISPPGQDVAA